MADRRGDLSWVFDWNDRADDGVAEKDERYNIASSVVPSKVLVTMFVYL
jgi:hypothetical protein